MTNWLSAAAERAPETLPLAIALASAWLGSDDPSGLCTFWFDLALSPIPLPDHVRVALAESAAALL